MSNYNFNFRRPRKLSFNSILISIFVIILLIIFIPLMLINRSKTILKYKLDLAQNDTEYVHLVQAAYSYLQTADAFIIFQNKDDQIRAQLHKKALNELLKNCNSWNKKQKDSLCSLWQKILTPKELKKCPNCKNY